MNVDENAYWQAMATIIKMEMTANGLTQAKLAENVGIARETLGNYLSGKREMPMPIFFKIASALSITPRQMFELAEKRLG
jgi:transcriptional regulator with XRE-family HTH domain